MPGADLATPMQASFEVTINGTPLSVSQRAHVTRLIVDQSVEWPNMFALELSGAERSGKKKLDEKITWVDDEALFSIGHIVEIKMGSVDRVETLLIGEITGLEPEFIFNRQPGLTVRGYDRRHRLQRGRRTRTWTNTKDSKIAEEIAKEAKLTAEVKDSKVEHPYVLQANQTNLEFLLERARLIEYEVMVEDKKLLFRPVANTETEALKLSATNGLLEFYPRLTSMGQVSEVSVRGWSTKEKKEIVGRAQTGDTPAAMGGKKSGSELATGAFDDAPEPLSAQPVWTQAEADQVAKARFEDLELDLITGEGLCLGRTELRAGKVVRIEGMGQRFSGLYYVTSAVHSYQPHRGYYTHFAVRRNAS